MKKNLFAAMLLAISCALFSNAQEQNQPLNQLLQTPDENDRWDFGLTTQVTVGFLQNKTRVTNSGFRSENQNQTGFGLGVFINYRLSEKWNLRTELGINADRDLNPYLSFQGEYLLNNRWSVYGGAGVYADVNARSLIDRDDTGRMILNPYIQLGTRYKFDKNWSMDLRYQQELYSRRKSTIGNFDIGAVSTFSLGVNYKF